MEAAFYSSRRWRMSSLVTASRISSYQPTRARSSLARPSPACSPSTTLRSAWTVKELGGQRVRRAPVAQCQIRGGVSASLRKRIHRGSRFSRPLLSIIAAEEEASAPRSLTAPRRSSLPLTPAATPLGSLTRQRLHSSTPENRQTTGITSASVSESATAFSFTCATEPDSPRARRRGD